MTEPEVDPDPGQASPAALSPLRVDNVSVTFGGVRAIVDVSVEIRPATIVSIIGPNGAGKTTLLNSVCSLVPKSHGTVHHYDREITKWSPSRIAASGVGRSFQDPRLLEDATVLENVLCGVHCTVGYGLAEQVFRRRKIHRCEAAARDSAIEILELVQLARFAQTRASELAYGARKIVDIVRATVSKPSLLLLDEPSSGLDRKERSQVESMLLTIHESYGIPMLVVEHHMDLVRRISDQVIGLVSGSVALAGAPDDVLDSAEFRALIVGGLPSSGLSGPLASEADEEATEWLS